MSIDKSYRGFELGPIRPPSEAHSLLLRVVRNCPWNRCTFCTLYKGETFSVRPVAHVLRDIDRIRDFVDRIEAERQGAGGTAARQLVEFQAALSPADQLAFHTALNWLRGGKRSVFLQDANVLTLKPADLVAILQHLRQVFPEIRRITAYARSRSAARIKEEDLARIAVAGLNRIHVGMESGSDAVLGMVRKGVDKQTHITAGRRIKHAGIELSEYFMPGLGGREFSRVNALETADALNRIDPDFIRVRTLAIPEAAELAREVGAGRFTPLGELEAAGELLLFLENLHGISSTVKSDHILNLFQDLDGRLPDDHARMTDIVRRFLALEPPRQLLYVVGRRSGIFTGLGDLDDPELSRHAENALVAHGVSWDNLDRWSAQMMQRFI